MTKPSTKAPIQRRRLTQDQYLQVCMWLKENESRPVIRKSSVMEIAGRCGAKLGFTVLPKQIRRAAESLHIKWLLEPTESASNHAPNRHAASRRDVAKLTAFVFELYEKWEDEIPKELENLNKRYNP